MKTARLNKFELLLQKIVLVAGVGLALAAIPHASAHQEQSVSAPVSAPVSMQTINEVEPLQKKVLIEKAYADMDIEERKDAIRYELASHGVSESEIEIFVKIAGKESNYREHIEPITWVLHCHAKGQIKHTTLLRSGTVDKRLVILETKK